MLLPSMTQVDTTDSGAVQLPSTVPTRTNYMFKGWCTIQVADGGECTGTGVTQIQPSGFLALNAGTSPSNPEQRTLYAMWKSNKLDPNLNVPDEWTCTIDQPCSLEITANPAATGFIILTVYETTTYMPLTNGSVSVSLPSFPEAGVYNASIIYTGDDFFSPVEMSITVTVN